MTLNNQSFTPELNRTFSEQGLIATKQSIKLCSNDSYRKVQPLVEDKSYPSNKIRTSKYTWYDFIPKNLFEQFTKLPNLYFLVISILQMLPYTTNTGGVPYIYTPLGIIIFLSAITDLYEDYHRSVLDNKENNQDVTQLTSKGLKQIKSMDIMVGMLLIIKKGQNIPCDGILIHSQEQHIYVETKNLDGQTNYKRKYVHPCVKQQFSYDEQKLNMGDLLFSCEPPNNNLLSFAGHINSRQPMNLNNILLRSSKLENPEKIVIMAVYTGHESKMLLNMNKPIMKNTLLTRKLGYTVICVFLLVFLISITISSITLSSVKSQEGYAAHFIKYWGSWILNLAYFILLFRNYVPISLLVTVEIVTVLQGKLMQKDQKLQSEGIKPVVNVSSVLQDLGAINFLATDKTGTLTKNILTFKQLAVCGKIYHQTQKILNPQILKPLGLCHQTFVSPHGQYEGVSQDEISILQYCRKHNFQMKQRTQTSIKYICGNKQQIVQVIKTIQFSSQRKRQSIILKQQDRYYLFTKGADDVMMNRIKNNQNKTKTYDDVNKLALKGRRTLLYAYKQLEPLLFLQWLELYTAHTVLQQLDKLHELQDQIQTELQSLCATGIQDQLQAQVQQTIRDIIAAGIKVTIISGDKPETVLSIANNITIEGEAFLAPTKQYLSQYKSKQLVVFARCTPKQKAMIVKSMPGRVLAIGDGANDVAMLTASAVGIGIKGKQRMAASQAADIAVPQFKHLRRLLFYYGSEINRRNSALIKYNFYRNFIYSVPQLVFGLYSNFSGTNLYEPINAQIFNLFYTAFPISCFALFDQSQDQQILMMNKDNIYLQNQRHQTYSYLSFINILVQSHAQAFIGCYICFTLNSQANISPNDLTLYQTSTIFTFYIIILTNHKILNLVRKITLGFIGSLLIGVVSYFISIQLISKTTKSIAKVKIIWTIQTFMAFMLCFLLSLLMHHFMEGAIYIGTKAKKKYYQKINQGRGCFTSNKITNIQQL